MPSFCIMSDTQITSPTWRHSVNVRYTDHESNMKPFCIMSDTQIMSPTWCHSINVRYTDHESKCIWHNTEWRHVRLVICVSDIIQNDDGLVICVSAIIQNDNMLDSWSVYLTLYWMTPRWTRDLCIWHYTEWLHVGLVICVSDIIKNGSTLDLWSVYLTLYRMMMDSWSVYLPLYRMTTCWTRDLCIWHYTEWRHVGLMICASDIVQNDAMLDSWSHVVILYNGRYTDHESTWHHSVQCQMHRSWVQHGVILYNVRYTDHESNMFSFCIMADTQITSPTWILSV